MFFYLFEFGKHRPLYPLFLTTIPVLRKLHFLIFQVRFYTDFSFSILQVRFFTWHTYVYRPSKNAFYYQSNKISNSDSTSTENKSPTPLLLRKPPPAATYLVKYLHFHSGTMILKTPNSVYLPTTTLKTSILLSLYKCYYLTANDNFKMVPQRELCPLLSGERCLPLIRGALPPSYQESAAFLLSRERCLLLSGEPALILLGERCPYLIREVLFLLSGKCCLLLTSSCNSYNHLMILVFLNKLPLCFIRHFNILNIYEMGSCKVDTNEM